MSRYYNNYKNPNYRKNTNKKNKGKIASIVTTILVVLALFGVMGGIAALMQRNNTSNKDEYNTVYFIPSDDWKADGSSYGAWCWAETGLPGSKFVLATDENEDGVFELKIHKDYTGVNFIDLKPDTDGLGLNWANKRDQTDNVDLPTDNKVYYHQYANEWSNSADPIYNVTTEEVTVYVDITDFGSYAFTAHIYAFDKTGTAEATFVSMAQINDNLYTVTIPAGYTHLIFLDCDGTWDNVEWQTDDLVIPTGEANYYNLTTNQWTTSVE